MHKSTISLLVAVLIVSILAIPRQTAYAQISLPAEMNKTFTPIGIAAGGTSILRITIFNPNSFELTNAAWIDNMPSQITIVGIDSNTCGGSVTANPGSSTISLTNGTVPAQTGSTPGRCTVSIIVTASTPGNWINTIPARTLTSTGPGGVNITTTSPASATLNVTGTGVPSVSKSFGPNNIFAGEVSQLSVNITNNSNTTLTGASLRDDLPANVFLADPVSPTLSAACGGSASVTATAGGTSFTLNNGTIAPGATCTITVNVTGDVQGAYTNEIPPNRLQTNQGLTNATAATARLTVREIGLTKRFSDSTLQPGETTTLTITLQNPKSTDYTGVNVTDNLPPELNVNGPVTSTCGVPPGSVSSTATSVTLTNGRIPAGTPTNPGTCTITVPVIVLAGTPSGQYTNTIPRNTLTTDQGIGNLTAANATVTVSGTQMTGLKNFSPSSIPAGGNSRLRIDIFAPGDTDLTNFSVTDPLPPGVFISNSTPATFSGCGANAQLTAVTGESTISLTGGTIAAGTRCRIEVYVTSDTTTPPGAPHTNTILPTNITNDQGRAPANALTANLTVTGGGTLSISLVKGFQPPEVFGGAASTMSIELINPGSVTLTGIAFTDNMPAGMILANPVNFNVGSCGGTLTGTPGSNSFSFSDGTLPPISSCTLTLMATMTVNGNLTNTIDAGAITTTGNLATNAFATSASLTNLPGASVSKAFSPNPAPAGSVSLLTITILNTGNIGLTGLGLSDSLPAGLAIAGGSAPAAVNNCGGTLTAAAGTQLIQLANGALAGNSSCTIVVAITGANPGDFQNTIPAGALRTDPSVNVTNTTPAIDTLRITGDTPPVGGGGGGGGGADDDDAPQRAPRTNAFLIPVTGFKANIVTDLSNVPMETYTALGDVTLEIPNLGVEIPVVGVPKQNGTWNVSWLSHQAGWLEGSAFPSWNGNSVLTSHVYLPNGRPGPFANLHELKTRDQVIVHAFGQQYIFEVLTNAIVRPNDKSVMQHEERPWLTLVTCTDYDAKTDTYKNRFIVRAVLVQVSEDR